jgi:hypothetical protein
MLKVVILLFIPASVLVFRSRLLTVKAFVDIKKNQGNRSGIAYSRFVQLMNNLFFLSGLRNKNYIEYIEFRNLNRGKWEKTAETATIGFTLFWLFIRVW